MTIDRNLVNRFRPQLETLESRDLMSVTSAVLNAGVLRVTLDNGNDFVTIRETLPEYRAATVAAGPRLMASSNLVPVNLGTLTVTDANNGNTWTFNRSSVQKIEIDNHNSYGDTNTIISSSSLPTTVDLRNSKGTNHVETGAGNDTVFGSDGNDSIWTNGGNDAVAAGLGDDRIDGGAGSDSLFGGGGNDTLIDVFASSDTNLLYGDAGNDTIFSTSRNDVVDGGTEIDAVNVKAGTSIVRNVESVSIDVPTGDAITDPRSSSRQAANRFLAAYGLPPRSAGYAVNDSAGLDTSTMYNFVKAGKPDVSLNSNATNGNIITVLRMGKPVIARVGNTWAVITGYNATTKLFTYIGMDGTQRTSPLSGGNRAIIY